MLDVAVQKYLDLRVAFPDGDIKSSDQEDADQSQPHPCIPERLLPLCR